jgi:hypothetical protein
MTTFIRMSNSSNIKFDLKKKNLRKNVFDYNLKRVYGALSQKASKLNSLFLSVGKTP